MILDYKSRSFTFGILFLFCCIFVYTNNAESIHDKTAVAASNTEDITSPLSDQAEENYKRDDEDDEEEFTLLNQDDDEDQNEREESDNTSQGATSTSPFQPQSVVSQLEKRRIRDVIVQGNKQVSTAAILTRVPFQKGDIFDPSKTRDTIKRLYHDLKRFRFIEIKVDPIDPDEIDVYIIIEEKKILKDYQFIGNKQISTKDILEKIPFAQMPAIDPEELKVVVKKIKQLYASKGYDVVDIDTQLTLDENERATVVFTFHEYPKSLVKRIQFTGNNHVAGKKLRSIMFSREDWLLGFLDQSGIYQPERIAADRHIIEQHYQNEGYINAKVTDVQVIFDEYKNISLTYDINEGEQYTIGEISVESADGIPAEKFLDWIPLKPGSVYSREKVVDSIKLLEHILGSRGYIFASVEPSIVPHESTKTVDISFMNDLGDRVYLNRLTITGNKKTRDKIIRRHILIAEGDLITNSLMEESKNRVEGLGYFEIRDGVNWKINRINETTADLELIIKEGKTGHASMQLGYGGTANIFSPADALTAEVNVNDTNFLGYGISVNLASRFAKSEKTFALNVTQPWLFDRPILAQFDAYHRRTAYEEFSLTDAVNEIRTGGILTTGFVKVFPTLYFNDIFFRFNVGIDGIEYNNVPEPIIETNPSIDINYNAARVQYNILLNKLFSPGSIGYFTLSLGQEKKNHPLHPSRGYNWVIRTNVGFPLSSNLSYGKFDFDYHWYTPLIGEHDLIFHWHNYLGFAYPLPDRLIPFGELFNIGGPASVRGYLFGQLSPRFSVNTQSDPVGASNAFFLNAELLFPIQPDMSIKGVIFYDGGTGWHNPYVNPNNNQFFINNTFDYRHSVGAGIRLTNPMPIKIDVGFKLDPRQNESPYEVHLGMNYGW